MGIGWKGVVRVALRRVCLRSSGRYGATCSLKRPRVSKERAQKLQARGGMVWKTGGGLGVGRDGLGGLLKESYVLMVG